MAKTKINVTIVGLGFVGSSIGLALKQSKANLTVIGHDKEPEVARKALRRKAVDKTDWNLISACENADIVVIATPVGAIRETLEAVGPYLKEGCLVMDTATVKEPVIRWADEILPDTVNFIGGDPVIEPPAGLHGVEAASAEAFKGALYCLVPSPRASGSSLELASAFVSALGAVPYYIDAAEHDGLMAGVEHLPVVAALALLDTLSRTPPWREMRKLAGGFFRRGTELSSYDPAFFRDTCLVNAANIVRWIDEYVARLEAIKDYILNEDAESLSGLFETASGERERWLRDKARGTWEELPEIPKVPGMLETLLGFGGLRRRQEERKG